MEAFLFLLAAFFSEVAGTMVGFGSSTICLPLALFLLDFKTALVLVAVLHLFGNLGRITFFRHGLERRLLLSFGLPGVVAAVLGAGLVNYVPQAALKAILGGFVLTFSVLSLAKPNLQVPADRTNAAVGGALSGFFAGLIGTGGAIRGAFLTAFGLEKNVYVATAAAIALAIDLTRLPVYFAGGFLEPRYYFYLPLIVAVAFGGSYLGRRLVNKVPQALFRKLVLFAIALVSVKFILDGFR